MSINLMFLAIALLLEGNKKIFTTVVSMLIHNLMVAMLLSTKVVTFKITKTIDNIL